MALLSQGATGAGGGKARAVALEKVAGSRGHTCVPPESVESGERHCRNIWGDGTPRGKGAQSLKPDGGWMEKTVWSNEAGNITKSQKHP